MQIKIGEIVEGKITGIAKYGAFVSIDKDTAGMIHISEISSEFINDINARLKLNQTVKAVVLNVNAEGKLALSIKQLPKDIEPAEENKTGEPDGKSVEESAKVEKNPETPRSFEDMLNKFKKDSDEKMSDLKYPEQKKTGTSRRRTTQKFE